MTNSTDNKEVLNPREILLGDIRHQIDGKNIQKVVVNPINFTKFVELASSIVSDDERDYQKLLNRHRLAHQAVAVADDQSIIKISLDHVSLLPIKIGSRAVSLLNYEEGEAGKIIKDGDGIIKPILYRLAKPIIAKDQKIEEIEFLAKNFGDIEDIVAASNTANQTIALINSLAKPVTDGLKLQALPSWAVDQISFLDGITIGGKVLPRFL